MTGLMPHELIGGEGHRTMAKRRGEELVRSRSRLDGWVLKEIEAPRYGAP